MLHNDLSKCQLPTQKSIVKLETSLPTLTVVLTHYQTTNFSLFQTERVCRRQFQI